MANDNDHRSSQHQPHGKRSQANQHQDSVGDRAREMLGSSRQAASDTARRAADAFDANPLGILVGGLAIGALAGALVPRSAREKELLAPIGSQLGSRGRIALEAAKSAGLDELGSRGLTRDGLRDQAKGLLDGVARALSSAGAAAAQSARNAG